MERWEVDLATPRLCSYTGQQGGVAILAHTDAGSYDLFLEGKKYENIFNGQRLPTQSELVVLRRHVSRYYLFFDLVAPIALELLQEILPQYPRLIEARLNVSEAKDLVRNY